MFILQQYLFFISKIVLQFIALIQYLNADYFASKGEHFHFKDKEKSGFKQWKLYSNLICKYKSKYFTYNVTEIFQQI